MRFEPTALGGAWVIELDRHVDDRGAFARAFCEDEFASVGLPSRFPQCNLSFNTRAGTLRGMHLNAAAHFESKLIRCVRGSLYDVIVDLRSDSPTEGQWLGVELSAENGRALFVPEGFGHGFLTLEDSTDVFYQMGNFYQPDAARGFRWNDPQFAVQWPFEPKVISERDASFPDFDPRILEN
jgi:dTDP-4-dehydrorhamnose 3,5-epimerase